MLFVELDAISTSISTSTSSWDRHHRPGVYPSLPSHLLLHTAHHDSNLFHGTMEGKHEICAPISLAPHPAKDPPSVTDTKTYYCLAEIAAILTASLLFHGVYCMS